MTIQSVNTKTIFGLTTASALHQALSQSTIWHQAYLEANETIERFNQETKALKKVAVESKQKLEQVLNESAATAHQLTVENEALDKSLQELTAKCEALKQELSEVKAWAKHLEETNKENAELIKNQQEAITQALNEASQTAMLRNEATVELAQYKLAVKIAADNFLIAINNINN